jgi:hypothetical protein
MSYTRKQQGKKTKKTRNIRNRNNKKNNKKNKKYGGAAPALAFSTLTKSGLLGKKAISAVKVGSKLSKGKLSDVGVGLLDDAFLHSGNYLFGKKGKKQNKKQKGGNGDAIDALKITLETADKIPGITFIPAYKIFSGIKDKLFDLLDIVQNQDMQDILNTKEMPTEEIKKQIKNIINKNENIKTEIDKYKEVCSNLDKISGLPVIGKQIADAIPHREELCMAFTEFDETENIEENTTKIENPPKPTDDVLENNDNIDTQESKDTVIEENTTENENPKESTDTVIDENTTEIENHPETTDDVIENNDNIDTQESRDTVIEENTTENDTQNKNNTNFLKQNRMIENPFDKNDNVLENNNKNENCDKATGISGFLLGKEARICYPNKQKSGGSRKNKKSKKSNKKQRKGSRKTKKSYKRQHRKK